MRGATHGKTRRNIIMAAGVLAVTGIGLPWAAEEKELPAGGQKVTLMLGGKFCENYTEDVERALKSAECVTSER
jgi:hypothetical protein